MLTAYDWVTGDVSYMSTAFCHQ